MTVEKVQEVITKYRAELESLGIEKIDYSHEELLDSPENGLGHCLGMLDKMERFIEEGRHDKVMRWLGFIQAILWVNKIYTLEDLMNHNRKSEEENENN